MSRWLARMEYKFRRFGIDNLMIYITGTMLAVYIADNLLPFSISDFISLDIGRVLSGQVWRLITFVVVPPPPNTFILWVLIELAFYYWVGSSLENTWGRTRFTIFYMIGVIGAIVAAFITGWGTNRYLNISMLIALAAIAPNLEILMWFVLPIKLKWLAYLDGAVLLYYLIFNSWAGRAAVIASVVNLVVFFGDDFNGKIRNWSKYGKQRRNFRKSMRRNRDLYGDR